MLVVVVFDRLSDFAVVLEIFEEQYLISADHHCVFWTVDLVAELDQLHVGVA